MSELDELHKRIVQCSRCKLRSECTQVVPGTGPISAQVVFLVEAPRVREDTEGVPLVGRAGQLFRKALIGARIKSKHVYISNMVHCRPPEDRDPEPDEVEACWDWTLDTLKIIRPRIVVPIGRPVLFTLAYKLGFNKKIGQNPISKLAGKPIFIPERNFYCYPMLPLTFALYRQDVRSTFMAHMKYLGAAIPGWLERT